MNSVEQDTVPSSCELFEDVFKKAENLGNELIDELNNIFSILRAAKMEVISHNFQKKMSSEDIVISEVKSDRINKNNEGQ